MAKTSTKRAMLGSAISLLLCFAMLIGTTFAWFTDNVTSTNNIIKSGNLDVELYYMNSETTDWTKVDGNTNVFKKDTLWEPGHAAVVKLKVVNEGSLALKYQLGVNVASEQESVNVNDDKLRLSDYIKYGVVAGDQTYTREEAVTAVDATANALKVAYTSDSTELLPLSGTNTDNEDIVTMVVYMPTSVGNEANYKPDAVIPTINLGINLVATQKDHESDSFGTDYDKEATYPAANSVSILETCTEAFKIEVGEVTVTVPAGSEAGVYKLEVSNKTVETVGSDTTASFDISLYKDDAKVTGKTIPVEIFVGKLLNVSSVTHNGNSIAYNYNATTGIVSFETDSFSPFEVTYSSIGENVKLDGDKIVGGVFKGVNPATIDTSLAEDDSEYIAINYTKDGKTYYVVSERDKTVIVAAPDTEYTAVNNNYNVNKIEKNGLYKVFQNIVSNDHATVYLLPGTYNESTTVSVTSSVNIIGLGDKEEIKVVKIGVKDSTTIYKSGKRPSNRHLFNCTSDVSANPYIEVTISNLTLDATDTNNYKQEWTFMGKVSVRDAVDDNAAVQSIRKAKVKCYDLIIEKGNTTYWAFYVNGNNALDDQTKVCAYMYAENCVINGKNVVSTSGKYKFYHNNVKYNGGATYTGSTQQQMTADDWDW